MDAAKANEGQLDSVQAMAVISNFLPSLLPLSFVYSHQKWD